MGNKPGKERPQIQSISNPGVFDHFKFKGEDDLDSVTPNRPFGGKTVKKNAESASNLKGFFFCPFKL